VAENKIIKNGGVENMNKETKILIFLAVLGMIAGWIVVQLTRAESIKNCLDVYYRMELKDDDPCVKYLRYYLK